MVNENEIIKKFEDAGVDTTSIKRFFTLIDKNPGYDIIPERIKRYLKESENPDFRAQNKLSLDECFLAYKAVEN